MCGDIYYVVLSTRSNTRLFFFAEETFTVHGMDPLTRIPTHSSVFPCFLYFAGIITNYNMYLGKWIVLLHLDCSKELVTTHSLT